MRRSPHAHPGPPPSAGLVSAFGWPVAPRVHAVRGRWPAVGADRRAHRGYTLVELMVGLGIGLLLLSIALSWVGWQVGQHRDLLLRTRLTHDLHAAAHLVHQALTQAGQHPDSSLPAGVGSHAPAVGSPGDGGMDTASGPVLAFDNGLRFRQRMGPDASQWTERALRVQAGTVHWRLQASGAWQALTDPRSLTVNDWGWQARQQTWPVPYDCQPACDMGLASAQGEPHSQANSAGQPETPSDTPPAWPTGSQALAPAHAHATPPCTWAVSRWHYRIHLAGQATQRPALSHQVQRTQRLMNDQMVLLCS